MSEVLFNYNMRVRDYECDAQGIVNNANYQHYFEVARHEFLEENDLIFFELHENNVDLVATSVYIKYKASLKGGDHITCTVDSLEKDGIRYIFNQSIILKQNNKVCATAKTEVVCVVNGNVREPYVLDDKLLKFVK